MSSRRMIRWLQALNNWGRAWTEERKSRWRRVSGGSQTSSKMNQSSAWSGERRAGGDRRETLFYPIRWSPPYAWVSRYGCHRCCHPAARTDYGYGDRREPDPACRHPGWRDTPWERRLPPAHLGCNVSGEAWGYPGDNRKSWPDRPAVFLHGPDHRYYRKAPGEDGRDRLCLSHPAAGDPSALPQNRHERCKVIHGLTGRSGDVRGWSVRRLHRLPPPVPEDLCVWALLPAYHARVRRPSRVNPRDRLPCPVRGDEGCYLPPGQPLHLPGHHCRVRPRGWPDCRP